MSGISMNTLVQFLIDAMSLGGMYALMAIGLALVYGVLKLVNFAYGELIMVGGYTLVLFAFTPLPWLVIALISVMVSVATGLLLERVAFRPVRQASINTLLITSFAVSALLQNTGLLLVSPRPTAVPIPAFFAESFEFRGLLISKANILSVFVSLLMLGAFTLFLRKTSLGWALRAAADDFVMTRLLGVRANLVIASAFAMSGLFAGVVSIFWVGRIGSVYPTVGLQPILIAFVACVIGGMGSLVGAALGGYLLGFLTVGLQLALPQLLLDYRQAFVFAILILLVLFKPEGLVKGTTTERI